MNKLEQFIVVDGLVFQLDHANFTANVCGSRDAKDEVIIPYSVTYQEIQYIVTSILSNSFQDNDTINSIIFPNESKVKTICSNAFKNSIINTLFIPESLERLNSGWCNETPFLNSIIISPKNEYFNLYDQNYILGKSDQESEIYDMLLFAKRDIDIAIIPNFIKIIGPCCFQKCQKLSKIEFSEYSVLNSIGEYGFANTSINLINIPFNISDISVSAFSNCQNLNSIHIKPKIQLVSDNDMNKDTDFINKSFMALMSDYEKQKFEQICDHFRHYSRLSAKNYYSMIDEFVNFNKENDNELSIKRCILSGIIPSFYETLFKDKNGTVILINERQIENILAKGRQTVEKSFLKNHSLLLNNEDLNLIFKENQKKYEIMKSYYEIVKQLGYKFHFYFVYKATFEYDTFPLIEKHYPNNIKYINKWQNENKINLIIQKNTKNWIKVIFQLDNLTNVIHNKMIENFSSEQLNKADLENKNKIIKFTSEDACEYALYLIQNLKDAISSFIIQNTQKKNIFINELADKLYSNDTSNKIVFEQIVDDILNHKKYESWQNIKTLESAFLLKYCSSSCYNRLYIMLNKKIPPSSTIESSFAQMLNEREKVLSNPKSINLLLDKFLDDIKNQMNEYLSNYNSKFKSKMNINEFKIQLCLGCDAASFTSYIKDKQSDNEIENSKELKAQIKKIKKEMFKNIINGNFKSNEEYHQFINEHTNFDANCQKYFFNIMLQPFIWIFPVISLHLTQSINGHFSLHEEEDISILFKLLNEHKHFEARYFAADGDTALDQFHESAFELYEEHLYDLIDGKISLEDFLSTVKTLCKIFPIIDILHGEKTGRNRVINHIIRLGVESNLISKDELKSTLQIDDSTLNDTSQIGRMNDQYPIHLFQFVNVLKEYKKKHNASGLYLLIYTLLIESFRNVYMDIESRKSISELILYLLTLFIQNTTDLPDDTSLRKSSKKPKKYVYFASKIGLIQLINTTICLLTVLSDKSSSFFLGLERLSSRPEEEYFGEYRTHYIGNSNAKTAFRFAVRQSLARDFENDLNISFDINKKENIGGAHLNYKDSHDTELDTHSIENIKSFKIKEIAFDLFSTGIGDKPEHDPSTELFLNSLQQYFQNYPSSKSKNYSIIKGSDIVPRIKASKK